MPYIGKGANGFGIRERYRYSASGSQTAFTGSDLNSKTLQFDSGSLLDVYLNGVLLDTADYNTSTANTVTLTSGATASDEVMIIVYDVFSLSDAMPKTGGTFSGAVTHTGAFTSVGIDDNADATTMTIDTSENVGIGNTSPSSQYMTRLVVGDGSGTEGITIYSGNDSQGRLEFSDATSGDGRYAGGVVYNHSTNKLRFNTNGGNERLGIDSSGDVTVNSGNLVIGTSGKGIDFSSNTQSAVSGVGNQSELLDFYEEGDWTPVAYGASTSGSVTSGTLTGKYTRIGRIVHIEARATAVVLSSANGSYYIDGLPFTVGGTGYNSGSVSLYKVDFDPDTYVEINASGTTCYFLVSRDATTWTTLDQSAFGSQHYWFFTLIYTV